MGLTVATDHAALAAVLDRVVSADPVRGTVLGTIRTSLGDSAWGAWHAGGLAARSNPDYPVTVTGDWPAPVRAELAAALRELPQLRSVAGAAETVRPLADELWPGAELREVGQRLYRLDELTPPLGVSGHAAVATADDRALLHEWFAAFMRDVADVPPDPRRAGVEAADRALEEGVCFLWRNAAGENVALAARRPVIAGSARIGPVYTPPAARGRGYASAVTAVATRSILDDGAVPVLFTDLANPTSNKIYQRLGYRPVEDRLIISRG